MNQRKPFSFFATVAMLILAGGVLYYYVRQLPGEVGSTSANAGISGVSLNDLAERGDVDALMVQIRAGAKIDTAIEGGPAPQQGMTPLMTAIVAGQEKAAAAILTAKPTLEARSRNGRTALIWAAGWGTPDMVQKLLDSGAEKNARDDANWTALIMAAGRGDPQTVSRLIKAGADINAKNKWAQTPLMTALRAGNAEKVALLLEAGANCQESDLDGLSAVHLAADSDAPPAIFEMLLKRGAPINAQSAQGLTALMIAADRGDVERVKLLLANGANPNLKDKNGMTAYDWAAQRPDDKGKAVAELLKNAK
ncbi:MAG: ankyrin repeat domain-containing protein [Phycisphaerales bacterium]|nr:ankyrin repeat domain-containing protein [Planctomycetota bacterium]